VAHGKAVEKEAVVFHRLWRDGATLFIGAGSGGWCDFIYLNWVSAFDYPPNGVIPAVTTVSAGTLG